MSAITDPQGWSEQGPDSRGTTTSDLSDVVRSARNEGMYCGGLMVIASARRKWLADGDSMALDKSLRAGLLAAGFISEFEP